MISIWVLHGCLFIDIMGKVFCGLERVLECIRQSSLRKLMLVNERQKRKGIRDAVLANITGFDLSYQPCQG